MNLIQQAISILQERLAVSERKLTLASGDKLTREVLNNGILHLELRNVVKEANNSATGFYCSICGIRSDTTTQRA